MIRSTLLLSSLLLATSALAEGPLYKPSSKSKAPLDISTNAYGAYDDTPKAPKIGEVLENFTLPSTRGTFDLDKARAKEKLVIVFYRGDW